MATREDRRRFEQHSLVLEIEREVRDTAAYTGFDALDPRVMAAIAGVPRHRFVPEDEQNFAYLNQPLPIGHNQTISQPYIVALMTHLLRLEPDDVVLEVGTGSGYQAAILSCIAGKIYSVEVIEPLARAAAERLRDLGYDNVEVRCADGADGWPEHAPYDAVIVTAAAPDVPPALIEQLGPGGRLAMPVGDNLAQTLMLVEKSPDGEIARRPVLPVAFVPLTHGKKQ